MLTPVIGQGWLKAKGSWEGRGGWRGRMAYLGGDCQNGVTLWFPLQTAPWPHIDPHLNLKHVSDLLCSGCGWLLDERHSSVSDAWVEPFYFWMCGWNWVYYCYYYCQPFNSLMIAYWISASLCCTVALMSPPLNVIGALQLNSQWLVTTQHFLAILCSL